MSKLDLANLLHQKTIQLKLTRSELASNAGISRQTLYKLLNAEIDEAKLSTLIKLSQALMLHPMDLLKIYFDGTMLKHKASTDNSGFLGDVTYPDNSIVMVNQLFTKVWEIKNIGKTTWKDRKLICIDEQLQVSSSDKELNIKAQRGLTPITTSIDVPETKPGESIQLSVEFLAPDYACTAISYWKSVDSNGEYCFPELEGLSCLVKVISL